jgi:hypothetical protein
MPNTRRILIVDDDPELRDALTEHSSAKIGFAPEKGSLVLRSVAEGLGFWAKAAFVRESEMVKINLTLEQASDLISQMKTAESGRVRFMEIVMPNGKKLAECRGEYVRDVGRALEALTRDSPVDQRVLR